MWIHLVALGLISGAGSGAAPTPDVQQFIHYAEKGSNSSATARKKWADKQQPVGAKAAQKSAATGTELDALKALEAGLLAQPQTDATKLIGSAAKADAQQQVLEAFRQALINEQQTEQDLIEQDDEDAIVALLLSL